MKPDRVVAKSIHSVADEDKISNRELVARVCYLYPQYNLQTAMKLPIRDIKLLLKVAEQVDAQRYYNLTQIAAAPHTKKGKGVNDLTNHFKKLMK